MLVCVCVSGAAVDWWALGVCLYVLFLCCNGLVAIRNVLICVVFVLQELQWTGGH
jgi:hypothetical protein